MTNKVLFILICTFFDLMEGIAAVLLAHTGYTCWG